MAVSANPPGGKAPLDEVLLSGYLDGTLSQLDAQRVRLGLEKDAVLRQSFRELRLLREVALSTRFAAPAEIDWPELPQSLPSSYSRLAGWLLVVGWILLLLVIGAGELMSGRHGWLELVLFLALPGGLVLLFFSVLLDRLKSLKTDRYCGVER
jgi:hypothetical protein